MTVARAVRMAMSTPTMRMAMMAATMLECKDANQIDKKSHKRHQKQALVVNLRRLHGPLENNNTHKCHKDTSLNNFNFKT